MSMILIPPQTASEFTPFAPVGVPVGEVVATSRTAHHTVVENSGVSVGVWECTEGSFRRQIMQAEYSYFIEGAGSFTPDGEEPIDFKAGDSVFFSANTNGLWKISERVRKSYIIIG
ncbi:cupin domain-containing protein [Pseudomonas sp. O230]|uniref:cupin domain-containing protein n=1 Tax=Pseudomonas sp. O230 TaxID=3159450 RepID=UPI00387ADC90